LLYQYTERADASIFKHNLTLRSCFDIGFNNLNK